jgi:putative tricarboxylic transport membrane protein
MNNNTKKIFNHKYILVIFLYIIGFLFLFSTPSIKDSGARVFPYILSISTIVSATIVLLRTYYNLDKEENSVDFSGTSFVLFIIIMLIFYIGLMKIIGFYLSSFLFLCLFMWLLGQKNIKLIILLSLLSVSMIYIFFNQFLGLRI